MAAAVGVGEGVAAPVDVGEGVAAPVDVGEGVAAPVDVGGGVALAVGVGGGGAEVAAVQSRVPESHSGSSSTNLSVPCALLSLGNEPLTSYRPGMPGPKVSSTMSRGTGYIWGPSKMQVSPRTSDAVNCSTCDPSPDTVKSTVPQGGESQPVISPV